MTRFCRHLLLGPLLWRLVAVAAAALMVGGSGCVHTRATPPPPEAIAPTKPDHEQGVETGIPVASTPQGLLREGAEKRIQSRLQARGLLRPEQINGQLDGDTRQALRKFQKSEGLPATGLPSYETVERLGLKLDEIFHTTPRPRASGGAFDADVYVHLTGHALGEARNPEAGAADKTCPSP